jgi:hypothetical protein
MNKISNKTIKSVVKEIVRSFDPKLVILFGSYGRGKPTKESDLDLFIVANIKGSPPERFRCVQRAITASGFGIDVVIRTPEEFDRSMSGRDWFVQEIVEQGKVLYAQ